MRNEIRCHFYPLINLYLNTVFGNLLLFFDYMYVENIRLFAFRPYLTCRIILTILALCIIFKYDSKMFGISLVLH